MESLLKGSYPKFQVFGSEDQVLQLLVPHSHAVVTRKEYLVYMSSKLVSRPFGNRLWERLSYSLQNPLNTMIINREEPIEYVGLSHTKGGRIIAVNPKFIKHSFFVKGENILAYTPKMKIQKVNLACRQLRSCQWYSLSGNSIVYIQKAGPIVEKNLGKNEEIVVKTQGLIGFSSGTRISEKGTGQILMKGPGQVYLSASSTGVTASSRFKTFTVMFFYCFFIGFLFLVLLIPEEYLIEE